jgi:hypothetical protein
VKKTTKPDVEKKSIIRFQKTDEGSVYPPSVDVLTKLQRNLVIFFRFTGPRRYVGSRKKTDVSKIVKNPVLIGNTSELNAR